MTTIPRFSRSWDDGAVGSLSPRFACSFKSKGWTKTSGNGSFATGEEDSAGILFCSFELRWIVLQHQSLLKFLKTIYELTHEPTSRIRPAFNAALFPPKPRHQPLGSQLAKQLHALGVYTHKFQSCLPFCLLWKFIPSGSFRSFLWYRSWEYLEKFLPLFLAVTKYDHRLFSGQVVIPNQPNH